MNELWQRCIEHWLAALYDHSGSQDTLDTYRSIIDRFLTFVGKPPDQVVRSDVASFLALASTSRRNTGKPLSASCKNQRLSCIASLYKYASAYQVERDDGQLSPLFDRALPTAGMKILKRDFQPRQMSEEELTRLFSVIPNTRAGRQHRVIFTLYLILGRRKAELMRLRFGDIFSVTIDGKPSHAYRYYGKGNSRYQHQKELPEEMYTLLCAWLESEGRLSTIGPLDYLFINQAGNGGSKGKTLHPDYVANMFHHYLLKAQLDTSRLSLHSLRWSSAYHRMMLGESLMQVRDALDHSTTTITEHYLSGMKAMHDTGADRLMQQFSFLH